MCWDLVLERSVILVSVWIIFLLWCRAWHWLSFLPCHENCMIKWSDISDDISKWLSLQLCVYFFIWRIWLTSRIVCHFSCKTLKHVMLTFNWRTNSNWTFKMSRSVFVRSKYRLNWNVHLELETNGLLFSRCLAYINIERVILFNYKCLCNCLPFSAVIIICCVCLVYF